MNFAFQCLNHNDVQPEYIVLNSSLSDQERILCEKCWKISKWKSNAISQKDAIFRIESKQNEVKNDIQNQTNTLNKIVEQVKNLLNQLNFYYGSLISQIENWKEDLTKMTFKDNENNSQFFLQELDRINQKQMLSKEKQFYETNRAYLLKMIHGFNTNDFRKKLEELQKILVKLFKETKIKVPEYNIKLKKINQIKQDSCCLSLVFNQFNTLMISTKLHQIQIWSFDKGIINLKQILDVHTKWVNCLVYSKKIDAFISGSDDSTIVITKLVNEKWVSSKPFHRHQMEVYCLLLNQEEDLLFSGSCDKSIIVWKLDFQKNQLEFHYQLDKHKNSIYSLSLNQKENILISCANQKDQIIVWGKEEKEDKLTFKYIVKQKDSKNLYGKKIFFLSDNRFLWVTANDGVDKIFIFESTKGVFEENKEKTIELVQNQEIEDQFEFPIIEINQNKIILVRHKNQIHFLQDQGNGKLVKIYCMQCLTKNTYGSLTSKGEFLVYWDNDILGYQIYEVNYT
ncbi:unnamed protein product [Paramecium sonneborni]|uniref:WD40-repeat-containing domain n=1 Tax=Paramecium sonneborni TaxID=65129 RepID=A0A8S1KZR8_9CILI|nr:unnamed protein product [Paramecium sonneborni]